MMLAQHRLAAPRIVERSPVRMAVVETVGDPDEVGTRALYGAIAQLGLKSGPLRARWPNASDHPREEWVARWALPVPDHTPELGSGISLETWYGALVRSPADDHPLRDPPLASSSLTPRGDLTARGRDVQDVVL